MKWRWHPVWLVVVLASVALGDEVVELRPYEVEAWHFDTMGLEVAADVVRLELSDLETSLETSVPELLGKHAGVRFSGFTGNGTEGQLALRGFGDNSGLRVLVMVDGLTYNPSDMGGINWMGLDVGELASVEVIRGGQSVLYGNHAVAGVIKLKTRDPGDEREGRIRLEHGSNSTNRGSLGLSQKFNGLGLRVGTYFLDTDGFRENSSAESRGGQLAWKLDEEGGANWSGRIHLDQSHNEYPGPLTYEEARQDPSQSGYILAEQSQTDTLVATIGASGAEDWGEWEAQAGYLSRDRTWRQGAVDIAEPSETRNEQDRWTLSPRVLLPFKQQSIIIGADLKQDWLESSNYIQAPEDILRSEADIERTAIGGYLFWRWALGPEWELSAGVRMESAQTDYRYERFKEEQLRPELVTNRGTLPNPAYKNPPDVDPVLSFAGPVTKSGWAAEISLVKTLSETVSIWGGWDRLYRYPSLDETAAYQDYPLSIPFNRDLEPETGNNFELGIKRSGSNWSGGATVFYMVINNEIFFDEDALLNTNLGETERLGLELDASWQVERYGFSVRTAWVDASFRQKGKVGGRRSIPLVPDFTSQVTAWFLVGPDWRLSFDMQYQAERIQGNDFLNDSQRVPASFLGGISLQWEVYSGLDLTFRINNVFDRNHIVTAYSGGFYPGPGREFYAGIRASF